MHIKKSVKSISRISIAVSLGTFAFAMLILNISSASAVQAAFVARLSGDQEVPPVDTKARGQANFLFTGEGLNFQVKVANIENITAAHIHCAPEGVNGPVVAFLFGPSTGVTVNGRLAQGTITDAEIINFACGSDLDGLVNAMANGSTYVNVHTTANPGGEIRGQIQGVFIP